MSFSGFVEILVVEGIPLGAAGLVWLLRWLFRRINKRERVPTSRPRCLAPPPFRSSGVIDADVLHEAVDATGRVPLEPAGDAGGLVGFFQLAKRVLFLRNTSPKLAFGVSAWQYTRNADSPEHSAHRGFILSFALHSAENRRHLKHSLVRGTWRINPEIPVAIASAKDMANPHAWVRCLVVDHSTLDIPDDKPGWVAVQSASTGTGKEPIVYSAPQTEVPDHALWLVTTNPDHTVPSPTWGDLSEALAPAPVPAHQSPPIDHDPGVKRIGRGFLVHKWRVILLVGPAPSLLFAAMALSLEAVFKISALPLVLAYTGMI